MLSTQPETVTTALGLRSRLTKFLGNGTSWKKPLREVIGKIEKERWRAVIFGGVVRDLAVFGPTERPRDVDIVLAGASGDEIERIFETWVVRRTRFGGVRLLVEKWMFDIWDVSSTWGINQLGLDPSFCELPRTTFLNVEAVAAEIGSKPGFERKIYSRAFFKALEERTVDINLEENPFPALCVVRSLITAARLDFSIGRALAEYVVEHAREEGLQELVKIQESHYGTVRATEARLTSWIASIDNQLEAGQTKIRLPLERGEQLKLSNFWSPSV